MDRQPNCWFSGLYQFRKQNSHVKGPNKRTGKRVGDQWVCVFVGIENQQSRHRGERRVTRGSRRILPRENEKQGHCGEGMGEAGGDFSAPSDWRFCEPLWVEFGGRGGVARGAGAGVAAARRPEGECGGGGEGRLGVWVREWGWGGERLVRGEEIGEKVSEMMSDRELRNRAREVGEEARKAWEVNGSSEKAMMGVIDGLKP
ncbi:UDP-Glycosyltransferase superfamily protein [Actinidia rufa]|uniref:UDP-Glycosyltransferase superfamily protein n=1 Tax=Actinidia rufa TaxID=165716 RepID=A0A7J0H890_9ERIC|nr:UDP-Glycosyltransferase superfamily protein [Actinidia rufa]